MPLCEYETQLDCSVENLFDFLSRPANVSRVTSPDLGITFTSAPDVLHTGARLDFQIITFGQLIKSSHEIVEFDRPHIVIEQQVTGPMKAWRHRHEYEANGNGTLMRDVVEFQLPGGILGLMLSESKVCDHLEDGFFYREQRLKELIASGELA
ncbi:MAG TPA: SRPBCC family protein [Planctomicrobium sp.]|nr:SRPBCC family protein [Planctomicrobium sp.]